MLIVLASRHDPTARTLSAEWAEDEALVVTCEDLSQPGWQHWVPHQDRGSAVIGGRTIARSKISAVLTRLPSVSEDELPSILPADRSYVAQEVMAFLVSWLASLGPRVVNRPTPFCLMGPHWRAERWVKVACELGLRTAPFARRAEFGRPHPHPDRRPLHSVTVVGNQAFCADGSPAQGVPRQAALRVAHTAGATLLAVRFNEEDALVDAHLWPDLPVGAVRDAVRDLLRTLPP